jgi:hypothetical protein
MSRDESRLLAARDMRIEDFMGDLDLGALKRAGVEWTGPCPSCGGVDRFSINLRKNQWLCRKCSPSGGDGIALVQLVKACRLPDAIDWLVGKTDVTLDPAVEAERARKRAADRARSDREAAKRRDEAIRQATRIWTETQMADKTQVTGYLLRRGMPRDLAERPPRCLRFHPSLPYMVDSGAGWVEVHRGPAMVAAMSRPDGRLTAVHRTWIDLGTPKGKAQIARDGVPLPAKKMWGSKKGTAIRLTHDDARGFSTLVMGEGIETTLTALASGREAGSAFWAGGDLGNMGGKRQLGPGLKYAGLPDMGDAEAFVPPPGLQRLIYVQDGDSEPRLTRAILLAGLRRAKALNPGLWIGLVKAPEGADLNDVLMAEGVEG